MEEKGLLKVIVDLTEQLNALQTPSNNSYKIQKVSTGQNLFDRLNASAQEYYRSLDVKKQLTKNRIKNFTSDSTLYEGSITALPKRQSLKKQHIQ